MNKLLWPVASRMMHSGETWRYLPLCSVSGTLQGRDGGREKSRGGQMKRKNLLRLVLQRKQFTDTKTDKLTKMEIV